MDSQEDYGKYQGLQGDPQIAAMPLERDALRRFVQAIMDHDPLYFDETAADASKFGGLAAPPLYPVHAFRLPADTPDPLDVISKDPNADGTAGIMGVAFGLPPIEMPYRRLLNGGNEIEFYRSLRVGERTVAHPKYVDVTLKEGKSGRMLLVTIETRFSTEAGEPLLLNRQTLIWR
ncbi:MaoC family dehydratase N-terminal domain-containing protein [Bradyrhizobium sp. LHD-71]|uniref:FAS1-like dehydratase domain-containing protein n=1 Tax=Bradyrhizobium sp. LHD-71 TaxID=3072141 RepID=UPI00280D8633|nr:MaoC family dehydratase N-terminal domain-containing protein [Bradyrhizobium sp. LHD-71]MDQ8729192.1 MaoC family dehydratase N-terminal domain-containing protein [Bradyrhizobium sp. LHD-71]